MSISKQIKSNEVLLAHQVDSCEVNDAEEQSPIIVEKKKWFNKKRLIIAVSALTLLSIFIGVLSYVLTPKSVEQFRDELNELINTRYEAINENEADVLVHEISKLYSEGKISSDPDVELSAMMAFGEYNVKYVKRYSNYDDMRSNFLNFRENFFRVKYHPESSLYKLKLNSYSSLSDDEFMSMFIPVTEGDVPAIDKINVGDDSCPIAKILTPASYINKVRLAKGILVDVTDVCKLNGEDIDWRRVEGVTPVRNQGNCGSCWAFATVAAIESAYAIQRDYKVTLSPQELINCSLDNNGCMGGYPVRALSYVRTYGISEEQSYPYVAKGELCIVKRSPRLFIKEFLSATANDVSSILLPLGPVIVSVAVTAEWLLYGGGIYTGPCGSEINHDVLLVGEGKDEVSGKRYWIIKNSWGEDWGEDGYMRLEKTGYGLDKCLILKNGYIPLL